MPGPVSTLSLLVLPRFDPGDALEKEMTTHSSILAGMVPWTEEPHELQSIGSQSDLDMTAGHD